ncbi:Type 4 prepilin-like proteins leader peptide-processing enzyme [Microbacterium sp. C448]|uniref:prepilin peptidase n=1 Tax=Microbacterium sp. C448 TaxID=1177594 RepID=UPI0003DE1AC8|nr:A24 family peptidase [Microbacterium sp. C448]CDK01035.1 Type 4 prepilin-like proteins leader peptide-processing enzyme [Microbacterium sp. C448]
MTAFAQTALTPPALGLIVAFAGVFGLVIGSFLNVVVYRVPAGIPLTRESRCPNCDAPVRPWQNVPVLSWVGLRGACASCSAKISPRYPVVEATTGAIFAGVAWFFATGYLSTSEGSTSTAATVVVALAFLYFAAVSVVLSLIDLDTRRLPNVIVLPSYVVSLVVLALACILGADWSALLRSILAMAALFAFYAILRAIRPDGMGGGDVKLAGLIGIQLGWLGWGSVVVGAFAAFVLGGIFGVALLLARRAGRRTAIPFGPWMLVGAWVGIIAGEPIARWYLGLLVGA